MAIIYKITNKVNAKVYIVFTTKTLEERWKAHLKDVRRESNTIFHNSIRKYGPESFYKEILTESDNEEFLLNIMESQYIAMYQSNNPDYGYNMTSGGEGGSKNQEARQRLSKIMIGKNLGKKLPPITEDHRRKLSEAQKGKKFSEEHCRNLSISKIGSNHPMFGKKRSEETRHKISESLRGRKPSEEHQRKVAESNRGKKRSEEARRNMSEARKKYLLNKHGQSRNISGPTKD